MHAEDRYQTTHPQEEGELEPTKEERAPWATPPNGQPTAVAPEGLVADLTPSNGMATRKGRSRRIPHLAHKMENADGPLGEAKWNAK